MKTAKLKHGDTEIEYNPEHMAPLAQFMCRRCNVCLSITAEDHERTAFLTCPDCDQEVDDEDGEDLSN